MDSWFTARQFPSNRSPRSPASTTRSRGADDDMMRDDNGTVRFLPLVTTLPRPLVLRDANLALPWDNIFDFNVAEAIHAICMDCSGCSRRTPHSDLCFDPYISVPHTPTSWSEPEPGSTKKPADGALEYLKSVRSRGACVSLPCQPTVPVEPTRWPGRAMCDNVRWVRDADDAEDHKRYDCDRITLLPCVMWIATSPALLAVGTHSQDSHKSCLIMFMCGASIGANRIEREWAMSKVQSHSSVAAWIAQVASLQCDACHGEATTMHPAIASIIWQLHERFPSRLHIPRPGGNDDQVLEGVLRSWDGKRQIQIAMMPLAPAHVLCNWYGLLWPARSNLWKYGHQCVAREREWKRCSLLGHDAFVADGRVSAGLDQCSSRTALLNAVGRFSNFLDRCNGDRRRRATPDLASPLQADGLRAFVVARLGFPSAFACDRTLLTDMSRSLQPSPEPSEDDLSDDDDDDGEVEVPLPAQDDGDEEDGEEDNSDSEIENDVTHSKHPKKAARSSVVHQAPPPTAAASTAASPAVAPAAHTLSTPVAQPPAPPASDPSKASMSSKASTQTTIASAMSDASTASTIATATALACTATASQVHAHKRDRDTGADGASEPKKQQKLGDAAKKRFDVKSSMESALGVANSLVALPLVANSFDVSGAKHAITHSHKEFNEYVKSQKVNASRAALGSAIDCFKSVSLLGMQLAKALDNRNNTIDDLKRQLTDQIRARNALQFAGSATEGAGSRPADQANDGNDGGLNRQPSQPSQPPQLASIVVHTRGASHTGTDADADAHADADARPSRNGVPEKPDPAVLIEGMLRFLGALPSKSA